MEDKFTYYTDSTRTQQPVPKEPVPQDSVPQQSASQTQEVPQRQQSYAQQSASQPQQSYAQQAMPQQSVPQRQNTHEYSYQYSRAVPPERPVKKAKKKNSAFLKAIALGLVFGLTAGCTFQGVNLVSNYFSGEKSNVISSGKEAGKTELTTSSGGSLSAKSDVAAIAAKVMPSVVSITNLSVQQVRSFFGGMQEYESESCGSGIIIGQNDAELLVLTNNHVVADAQTLTVSFVDQESVSAQVKGTDASLDVAVISVPLSEVKDSTMDAIKIATLGNSDELQVGETAIAIGNALGYGQSVTCGIISALSRNLEGYDGGTLIQTDAAINPGNSGGALLNSNGEVIGVNVAKVAQSEVEGMGYAIPITNASEVITNLMNKETRTKVAEEKRGYIGISGVDVSKETSQFYNIPVGVYISEVNPGGGAENAGLSKGTVITSLDGTTIDSMSTLQDLLQYYEIGETVTMKVQIPSQTGEYTEKEVQVTLGRSS